jgi:hypothetical protein
MPASNLLARVLKIDRPRKPACFPCGGGALFVVDDAERPKQ